MSNNSWRLSSKILSEGGWHKLLSNMTVIIAIQRGARGSSANLTSNHVKKEKAISIAGKISRCYNTIMLPRTWQDYSRAFAPRTTKTFNLVTPLCDVPPPPGQLMKPNQVLWNNGTTNFHPIFESIFERERKFLHDESNSFFFTIIINLIHGWIGFEFGRKVGRKKKISICKYEWWFVFHMKNSW